MGWEVVAAIATVYGLFLTALLSARKIVLKVDDSEIDAVIRDFNKLVVKSRIRELGKHKTRAMQKTQLEELRKLLNASSLLEWNKNLIDKTALAAYALLLVSGLTSITAGAFIKEIPVTNLKLFMVVLISLLTGAMFVVALYLHGVALYNTRTNLDNLRSKLQEGELI